MKKPKLSSEGTLDEANFLIVNAQLAENGKMKKKGENRLRRAGVTPYRFTEQENKGKTLKRKKYRLKGKK